MSATPFAPDEFSPLERTALAHWRTSRAYRLGPATARPEHLPRQPPAGGGNSAAGSATPPGGCGTPEPRLPPGGTSSRSSTWSTSPTPRRCRLGRLLLRRTGDRQQVVDDDDLAAPAPAGGRHDRGLFAAVRPRAWWRRSTRDGAVVARAETDERNHAWLDGLEPDTEYRYRIESTATPWAEGPRRAWAPDATVGTARRPSDRAYDLRLPHPSRRRRPEPVAFLAFGDYGVGHRRRRVRRAPARVARTMEALAARHPVRFLVSLGDNIYHQGDDDTARPVRRRGRRLVPHLLRAVPLPDRPPAGVPGGGQPRRQGHRGERRPRPAGGQLPPPGALRATRRGRDGRRSTPGSSTASVPVRLLELVCVDTHVGRGGGHPLLRRRPITRRGWRTVAPGRRRGVGGGLPVWRVPVLPPPAVLRRPPPREHAGADRLRCSRSTGGRGCASCSAATSTTSSTASSTGSTS